jgi:hypothetical protein
MRDGSGKKEGDCGNQGFVLEFLFQVQFSRPVLIFVLYGIYSEFRCKYIHLCETQFKYTHLKDNSNCPSISGSRNI